MDDAGLRDILKELGWTQRELARRLGLHRNTVALMAGGQRKVPRYVAEYLRVMRLTKQIWSG